MPFYNNDFTPRTRNRPSPKTRCGPPRTKLYPEEYHLPNRTPKTVIIEISNDILDIVLHGKPKEKWVHPSRLLNHKKGGKYSLPISLLDHLTEEFAPPGGPVDGSIMSKGSRTHMNYVKAYEEHMAEEKKKREKKTNEKGKKLAKKMGVYEL